MNSDGCALPIGVAMASKNGGGVGTVNPTGGQTQESGQAASQSLCVAIGEEDSPKTCVNRQTSISPGEGGGTVHSERRFFTSFRSKPSDLFSRSCGWRKRCR